MKRPILKFSEIFRNCAYLCSHDQRTNKMELTPEQKAKAIEMMIEGKPGHQVSLAITLTVLSDPDTAFKYCLKNDNTQAAEIIAELFF